METQRCDIVFTIKDYIKPLMQIMTNDLKDYNMRLLTTKCLNTSVLLIILLLGEKAKQMADYCDSVLTTDRHTKINSENPDKNYNITLLNELRADILMPESTRCLYYILLTDANFTDLQGEDTGFFPGHVIVIEKFPRKTKPYYYLYQSYINEYNLHGHFEKTGGKSVKYSYKKMANFMIQLNYIITSETWTKTSEKYWREFTYVSTNQLIGTKSGNKIFMCYKKSPITECAKNVKDFVASKLQQLTMLDHSKLNDIYGDESIYETSEKPLSNIEIKEYLEKLYSSI